MAKYNSATDENYLTEAFVFLISSLLSRDRSIGCEILTQLCVKNNEFSFNAEEDISISTQETTEQGRPDIKVSSPDKLLYIEVKHDSPLGPQQLARYRKALELSAATTRHVVLLTRFAVDFEDQEERPFELKVFTDNIVIGWPIQQDGEAEFGFTLMNVAYYQLELMFDGLFVRGAMDIGPAYIDDYLAFGPPIITSHLLETKKAKYPRIILSTELELLVKRHLEYYRDPQKSPQYAHLLRDSDEMLFIDYLNVVFTTSDSIDDEKIYDLLTRHKESIEHNLGVPAIHESMRKKYEWSSNYHNYTVKRYMEANPKLIIPVNTDLGAPKSII